MKEFRVRVWDKIDKEMYQPEEIACIDFFNREIAIDQAAMTADQSIIIASYSRDFEDIKLMLSADCKDVKGRLYSKWKTFDSGDRFRKLIDCQIQRRSIERRLKDCKISSRRIIICKWSVEWSVFEASKIFKTDLFSTNLSKSYLFPLQR